MYLSSSKFFLHDNLNDLTHKSPRERKQIIILGDLNADCLNNSLAQTRALNDFIKRNDLEQFITEPTHSIGTSSILLDLLITSTPNPFMSAKVIKLGVSDHFLIYSILSTKSEQAKEPQHRLTNTQKIDLKANHETFLNELNRIP